MKICILLFFRFLNDKNNEEILNINISVTLMESTLVKKGCKITYILTN